MQVEATSHQTRPCGKLSDFDTSLKSKRKDGDSCKVTPTCVLPSYSKARRSIPFVFSQFSSITYNCLNLASPGYIGSYRPGMPSAIS